MSVRSLVPLLEGRESRPRTSFLIEYFSDIVFPRIRNMGYRAVRTGRWKYIHYTDRQDSDELYDLQNDPYELRNRIKDPAVPLAELKKRLAQLAPA